MTIKILNESNFDTETSTGTTLVDFYADWCGPCRMLSPIIESVADSLSGQINVVKVDVDKSPNLARRFNVKGIPTLLVVKDGNVVNRKTGMGTREQLLEFITKGE
jgi:thioredoxin 1